MIVGELAAILTANSSAFVTDFGKAEGVVKNFASGMKDAGKIMTGAFTAPILAAGAAIGGIISYAAGLADEMLRLSQSSGISTTTLQELKYAAAQTGVELSTITNSSFLLTR